MAFRKDRTGIKGSLGGSHSELIHPVLIMCLFKKVWLLLIHCIYIKGALGEVLSLNRKALIQYNGLIT